ncbi:MAG: AraC family transcriptional regulator [Betaproteobacteria bacterium]|nr:AraC family transcriptional regulator [Betaproteobacteria bacterium]
MIDAASLTALFDALPDVVFFIKDRDGCYTHANRTLLGRLGKRALHDVQGRTAADLFPAPLGDRYLAQDLAVIRTGEAIRDELEWHLFPSFAHGWCLTQKLPLHEHGKVIGLAGISRDLPSAGAGTFGRVKAALDYAERHLDSRLVIVDLAARAGLSIAQFERQVHRVYELTPRQWLLARRIERALPLIESGQNVAHIAQACGFSDHSAFTRAFRRHVGVAPRDYARVAGRGAAGQPKNR